jgi:hypothetical protein
LNGSGRHIVRGQGEKHRVDAAFTVTAGGATAPGQPTQTACPTRPGGVAADVARTTQPTAQPSTRHTTPTPTPTATAAAAAAAPSAATVGEEPIPATTAATKPTSGGSTGTVVAIIAIGLGIIGAGLLVVLALRQRTSSEKEQEVVADAVSTEV